MINPQCLCITPGKKNDNLKASICIKGKIKIKNNKLISNQVLDSST